MTVGASGGVAGGSLEAEADGDLEVAPGGSPAAAAPATISEAPAQAAPVGTWTLAGTDPVRGLFHGDVTVAPGKKPDEVQITYHAIFKDGSEGTVTGTGNFNDHAFWMSTPLKNGTGVFAPSANPGAASNAFFDVRYDVDTAGGSAVGSAHMEGVPKPPGVDDPSTQEGIARPSAEFPGVVPGGAIAPGPELWTQLNDIATRVQVGAAVPLGSFGGVPLPDAPELKLSGPDGNTMRAWVTLSPGQPPTVSIHFDKPLEVKGPWYMPKVEISDISMQGGKVTTDARFESDVLDGAPGLGSLPQKFADKAIAKAAASFEPLAKLLDARAQAGALPDGGAIMQAIQDAMAGGGAGAPPGLAGIQDKLDLAHTKATASLTLRHELDAPAADAIVVLHEGTQVEAGAAIDAKAGKPGELAIRFTPPAEVLNPKNPMLDGGLPSVNGIRIAPDGRVSIDGSSWTGLFDKMAAPEAARATAILTMLYNEVPADSDLGQALRRAGIGGG
jgi:hypothetical protein